MKPFVMLMSSLVIVLGLAGAQPGNAASISERAQGVWADEDGRSNIEISPCRQHLCGRIVWLSEPFDKNGNPKTDMNNPDVSQRNQPVVGMTIMKGLQPHDDGALLKGLVYNAENGKVYDVYLDPAGATMSVEGCFAMFLCGSQTWTRVK